MSVYISTADSFLTRYAGCAAAATGLGLTVKAQRKDYLPAE